MDKEDLAMERVVEIRPQQAQTGSTRDNLLRFAKQCETSDADMSLRYITKVLEEFDALSPSQQKAVLKYLRAKQGA